VPRLDYILKGGFVRGGTYLIVGPPGSGKTILGNQICFKLIADSRSNRCLYLTLLAETHGKMIRHLETLAFFDPTCVAQRLSYVSGYAVLRSHGLRGLLDMIRKSVKELRPSVLVIDGLQAAEKAARAATDFDEFIHELQAFVSIADCTTLLLRPTGADPVDTAHLVCDGVIELSYRLVGPRAVRELAVHKFRGTDYLLGRHEVEITHEGVQIHPRTEIQFADPPGRAHESRRRMAFGIRRLDQMVCGGLMSGTTTTLLGAPGTGKTLLGLSFLIEGARRGERGIYFGFYEPPPRLIEKAESVGLPLRRYTDRGLIEIVWQPPLEHFMDALAEQLLEGLRRGPAASRRLFIDGVEGFRASAVYPDRMSRFLSAFTNQLRTLDVTTLLSEELDLFKSDVHMPNPEVATVTEGVILLRYVEIQSQVQRLLSILKMRESLYDSAIRQFEITDRGLRVGESFTGAAPLLSGGGPAALRGGPLLAEAAPRPRTGRRRP
jgi:circadian clock protein KaiC